MARCCTRLGVIPADYYSVVYTYSRVYSFLKRFRLRLKKTLGIGRFSARPLTLTGVAANRSAERGDGEVESAGHRRV